MLLMRAKKLAFCEKKASIKKKLKKKFGVVAEPFWLCAT